MVFIDDSFKCGFIYGIQINSAGANTHSPCFYVVYFCGLTKKTEKHWHVLAHLFFLLRELHLHTKSFNKELVKLVINQLLTSKTRCSIGIETVKLLLSGTRHQILFTFYYPSDFVPTFADKTQRILRRAFIRNILTVSWLYLALVIISQPKYIQSRELYFKTTKLQAIFQRQPGD